MPNRSDDSAGSIRGQALAVKDVTKAFGELVVLAGVSLRVRRGESVAILGPSGSGKSTLAAICGLATTWDSGEVAVGAKSFGPRRKVTASERRCVAIGWMPQLPLILPGRTVLDNACLGQRYHLFENRAGESPQVLPDARVLLEAVGLGGLMHRSASVLSAGEAQRLGVARVLASGARLVIADEPTASLDARNSKRVIEALAYSRGGSTLLVATHDPQVALHCDRTLHLRDGRLRAKG